MMEILGTFSCSDDMRKLFNGIYLDLVFVVLFYEDSPTYNSRIVVSGNVYRGPYPAHLYIGEAEFTMADDTLEQGHLAFQQREIPCSRFLPSGWVDIEFCTLMNHGWINRKVQEILQDYGANL